MIHPEVYECQLFVIVLERESKKGEVVIRNLWLVKYICPCHTDMSTLGSRTDKTTLVIWLCCKCRGLGAPLSSAWPCSQISYHSSCDNGAPKLGHFSGTPAHQNPSSPRLSDSLVHIPPHLFHQSPITFTTNQNTDVAFTTLPFPANCSNNINF